MVNAGGVEHYAMGTVLPDYQVEVKWCGLRVSFSFVDIDGVGYKGILELVDMMVLAKCDAFEVVPWVSC